jgi:hypothetical protein
MGLEDIGPEDMDLEDMGVDDMGIDDMGIDDMGLDDMGLCDSPNIIPPTYLIGLRRKGASVAGVFGKVGSAPE